MQRVKDTRGRHTELGAAILPPRNMTLWSPPSSRLVAQLVVAGDEMMACVGERNSICSLLTGSDLGYLGTTSLPPPPPPPPLDTSDIGKEHIWQPYNNLNTARHTVGRTDNK
ncbi:hypothetical protein LY76DRAFT_602172 [Colletotrichum caudatum]|nr:hypothetical protein LY76DRAFT_602172 [Colletotrichum caudatum]